MAEGPVKSAALLAAKQAIIQPLLLQSRIISVVKISEKVYAMWSLYQNKNYSYILIVVVTLLSITRTIGEDDEMFKSLFIFHPQVA
jgi:hypothetical protein